MLARNAPSQTTYIKIHLLDIRGGGNGEYRSSLSYSILFEFSIAYLYVFFLFFFFFYISQLVICINCLLCLGLQSFIIEIHTNVQLFRQSKKTQSSFSTGVCDCFFLLFMSRIFPLLWHMHSTHWPNLRNKKTKKGFFQTYAYQINGIQPKKYKKHESKHVKMETFVFTYIGKNRWCIWLCIEMYIWVCF